MVAVLHVYCITVALHPPVLSTSVQGVNEGYEVEGMVASSLSDGDSLRSRTTVERCPSHLDVGVLVKFDLTCGFRHGEADIIGGGYWYNH